MAHHLGMRRMSPIHFCMRVHQVKNWDHTTNPVPVMGGLWGVHSRSDCPMN